MINRVTTSGDRPAELWEMRADETPIAMRRALGSCVGILRQRRLRLMNQTIYHKGLQLPGRFTGRLRRSEIATFIGVRAIVSNNAKSPRGYAYADKRHNMRGYSKKYRTRKESFWATKAIRETRGDRNKIIRDALRYINTGKRKR